MSASADYHARELPADEMPRVQALFDANPEYFLSLNDRAPGEDAAQTEFEDFPPPHLGFTRCWFAGLFDRDDELIGVAVIVSDLGARHVWHVALFLVATRLHGQGVASEIFAALETWAQKSGAWWLRLGVVQGSARAERFWEKHGFREVRTRAGIDTGGRLNDVRVLVKPLGTSDIAGYLAAVPRDRSDSPLP